MIEIAVVVWLTRHLFELARDRGAHGAWAALAPLVWVGGEVMGFFLANSFGVQGLGGYPFALLLAGLGVAVARAVVKQAPPKSSALRDAP